MKRTYKRILSVLLVLAMLAAFLPAGMVIATEPAAAEATGLTQADYAQADDIFAKITAMENEPAKKNSPQSVLTDEAQAIVTASDGYAEGSLVRNGDSFTWETDTGIRCIYSPRMRQINREMEAPAESQADGAYNEPVATKGPSKQVYLVGPYYGHDDDFTDQYKNEAKDIASAIGDADGYTLYSGAAATVDAVAQAVSNGAVVIFDSHGVTDYESGDDYVSGATSSYLCLTSTTGLTSADYDDGALYSYDGICINGATIANHMTSNSPGGLLWMAFCLGMATDTICQPLREMGVEVVYGYSQSVTFAGDYLYEETFWDEMCAGSTVAAASAAMKSEWGNWDWSTTIATYYGYSSGYSTISAARADYAAFPVVVSDVDAHPGQRNRNSFYGADSLQTVQSTYTLTLCAHTNAQSVAAVAPTCTQGGFTAGTYCGDCGSYLSGHEPVSALGHSYASGQCSRCGEEQPAERVLYFYNAYDWSWVYIYFWSDENTTMTSWPGEFMIPLGDDLYAYTIPAEATYVIFTDGYYQTYDLPIPANYNFYFYGEWTTYDICSHNYEGKATIQATCTTDGEMTYTCSFCGDSYTESIAALGHSYANGQCSLCGAAQPDDHVLYFFNAYDWSCVYIYYWSDENTTMTYWPGDAMTSMGGSMYTYTVPAEATYVIFTDGYYQTDDLPIPSDYNYYFFGYWTTYTCDHYYIGSVTTQATCTTGGMWTYTCSYCGDSYTESIEAWGHAYVDGICFLCGDQLAPAGITVSGRVTSYMEGDVIVELVQNGEVVYTATAIDGVYYIEDVAQGSYILRVVKANHVPQETELVVGQEPVAVDVTICPTGDVTGDGVVNIKDFQRLLRHVNKTNPLKDYALLCGDVTGDGVCNIKDFQRLLRHVNKTNPLF